MPFRIVFTGKQRADVEEFELRPPREGEVVVRSLCRGWFESVDRMIGYLDVTTEPVTSMDAVVVLVNRVLDGSGRVESDVALSCIRRYLSLVLTL